MLTSIELTGFKSFAKKHALSFSTPVTGIVGPNGSGKSNVAEAFRFVLGEQSVKSMRGKRGEDLIFGGSGELPKQNRASVTITFDNRKRIINCEFDEVSIRRTVFRDGVNEYAINDSVVRLKDVAELLASAHIGSTGHHMISQGEADRILSASATERKEMIEDALGLYVYQIRKEEAERNIVKAQQHIEELEHVQKELAPHLRFLKKQVQVIEEVAGVRNSLVEAYQKYFAAAYKQTSEKKVQLTADRQEAKQQLEESSKRLHEAKQKRDSIQESLTSFQHTRKGYEQELQSIRNQVLLGERAISKIDGELSSYQRLQSTNTQSQSVSVSRKALASCLVSIRSAAEEALGHLSDPSRCSEVLTGIVKTSMRFEQDFLGTESVQTPVHDDVLKQLNVERASLAEALSKTQEKLIQAEEKLKQFEANHEQSIASLTSVTEAFYTLQSAHEAAERRIAHIQQQSTELETLKQRIDQSLVEARHVCGRDAVAYESVAETDGDLFELEKTVERYKIRYEEHRIGNEDAVKKEYEEAMAQSTSIETELADVKKSKEHLSAVIDELTKTLRTKFDEGLKKVSAQFDEFFKLVFDGGSAAVKLTKEPRRKRGEDPEEEPEMVDGVGIDVELPRKKIRGLDVLSGGERALTSIALLFSLSQINPPPFIVLDETDAALDEANSRRYGDMIDLLSKRSQLILITHNRETMSRAGVLYGVTMGKDGASRLLSIKFEEAVQVAK